MPSTVTPSNLSKGRAPPPMPARKLNDTYTGLPKGIDILINAENLPPLPSLPSNLEHLPYTRYKRKLPSAGSSLTELRQHVAHQRREFVGDSVVKIFVVDWLINQHHCLYTRVAAYFAGVLISNALFARLARAYGMAEKLVAAHPGAEAALAQEAPKCLANAFEVYFGLLFGQVLNGRRPLSDLTESFGQLFSVEVFPHLETHLEAAQKACIANWIKENVNKRSNGTNQDSEEFSSNTQGDIRNTNRQQDIQKSQQLPTGPMHPAAQAQDSSQAKITLLPSTHYQNNHLGPHKQVSRPVLQPVSSPQKLPSRSAFQSATSSSLPGASEDTPKEADLRSLNSTSTSSNPLAHALSPDSGRTDDPPRTVGPLKILRDLPNSHERRRKVPITKSSDNAVVGMELRESLNISGEAPAENVNDPPAASGDLEAVPAQEHEKAGKLKEEEKSCQENDTATEGSRKAVLGEVIIISDSEDDAEPEEEGSPENENSRTIDKPPSKSKEEKKKSASKRRKGSQNDQSAGVEDEKDSNSETGDQPETRKKKKKSASKRRKRSQDDQSAELEDEKESNSERGDQPETRKKKRKSDQKEEGISKSKRAKTSSTLLEIRKKPLKVKALRKAGRSGRSLGTINIVITTQK